MYMLLSVCIIASNTQLNPDHITMPRIAVEERSRIGDWEADTVIGQHHKQAIVTLVERKTGLLKMSVWVIKQHSKYQRQ